MMRQSSERLIRDQTPPKTGDNVINQKSINQEIGKVCVVGFDASPKESAGTGVGVNTGVGGSVAGVVSSPVGVGVGVAVGGV
ncbi:MAG: hypothetical protein EHM38_10500, partial [Geobacteraceae bacterium]